MSNMIVKPTVAVTTEVERLSYINTTILRLNRSLELAAVLNTLLAIIAELDPARQALVFVRENQQHGGIGLRFGSATAAINELSGASHLRHGFIALYDAADRPLVAPILRGEITTLEVINLPEADPVRWLCSLAQFTTVTTLPISDGGQLQGSIFFSGTLEQNIQSILSAIAPSAAVAIYNAQVHSRIVGELSTHAHELNILQQIDRELNDVIELDHVFSMTLDWVLRFTQAQAAALALYNETTDELNIRAHYGYSLNDEQFEAIREEYPTSISQRVARTAHSEIIPDIAMDPDYVPFSGTTRSQMSVPVIREESVIAVISVESNRTNAFADNHLGFAEALASRAAVAIDNARLFTETKREREKLSHILSNVADAVIVADETGNILLVNQAAISVMQLYPNVTYNGRTFTDVFTEAAVLELFKRSSQQGHRVVQELVMPNGRTYYASATLYKGIGQIVVMQDITRFKELDQLKSELIATVSHDLKQPLSIMHGYLDLMLMVGNFNEQTTNYANRMARAIANMRSLIDDLLDIAKIESGVKLNFETVSLGEILEETVENLRQAATAKQMHLEFETPNNLPKIMADRARLHQIFNNLISNAIKYTPQEGHVAITTEQHEGEIRITVKDTGLGISPEDQAHIFDRFYRVRRPENDSIEGTGLGLAIVKSLVEAHKGQISVDSLLGVGSTFFVNLPIRADYASDGKTKTGEQQ